MDVIKKLQCRTSYRIQYFGSDFGYEPCWNTCNSYTDYDKSLSRYNELSITRPDLSIRLVSETTTVDILKERD